jgi:hypothetical protein
VIEIEGNRLDARFLRETGAFDDHFTIVKVDNSDLSLTTIRVDNEFLSTSWRSIAGHTYRIQRTATLTAPSWSSISPDIVATNDLSSWSGVLPTEEDTGFFRVIQIAP